MPGRLRDAYRLLNLVYGVLDAGLFEKYRAVCSHFRNRDFALTDLEWLSAWVFRCEERGARRRMRQLDANVLDGIDTVVQEVQHAFAAGGQECDHLLAI